MLVLDVRFGIGYGLLLAGGLGLAGWDWIFCSTSSQRIALDECVGAGYTWGASARKADCEYGASFFFGWFLRCFTHRIVILFSFLWLVFRWGIF